ncbi:hypothetical protein [Paenibacillus planticolens]|uniref:Uncharacterized protein n=1 Tax=Paenibacillus planticolens TaxID=2654976 RepID=A0ABX1ZLP0_9BACL|nr:hypothetical protein [Paenibacillus planticolens]NOU99796.1 hypothetical protein [Paenibacillus planticolens]
MKIIEVVSLLENYISVLELTQAPKKNIEAVRKIVRFFEKSEFDNLNALSNKLDQISSIKKKNNPKLKNVSFQDIQEYILDYKRSEPISNDVSVKIRDFINEYPRLNELVKISSDKLSEYLYSQNVESWTVEELKYILYYYFQIDARGKITRQALLEKITNYSLQTNHYKSIEKNFNKELSK